jgi:hypothetical protein
MTKEEALRLIDEHKNRLLDPVEMLHWTWLRVIILKIPADEWDKAVEEATKVISQ